MIATHALKGGTNPPVLMTMRGSTFQAPGKWVCPTKIKRACGRKTRPRFAASPGVSHHALTIMSGRNGGQNPFLEVGEIFRAKIVQDLSMFRPVMFCNSTPGGKTEKQDITVSDKNGSLMQIQMVNIRNCWIVVAVNKECLLALLMADASELGGKFPPDRAVSYVSHFCGIPVENDRGRTP